MLYKPELSSPLVAAVQPSNMGRKTCVKICVQYALLLFTANHGNSLHCSRI